MSEETYQLTVKGWLFPIRGDVDFEIRNEIADETHKNLLRTCKKNEVVIAPSRDRLEFINIGDLDEMYRFYNKFKWLRKIGL